MCAQKDGLTEMAETDETSGRLKSGRNEMSHPVGSGRMRQDDSGCENCWWAYLLVRASTPGSFLPSRNSRLAPPPVEMWVIWSATPAWLMADTESPPPMME